MSRRQMGGTEPDAQRISDAIMSAFKWKIVVKGEWIGVDEQKPRQSLGVTN